MLFDGVGCRRALMWEIPTILFAPGNFALLVVSGGGCRVIFLPGLEQGAVPVPPKTLLPVRASWEKPTEGYMPKPWTAEDVLTLQAMARKHPPEQIAAELGRGVTATMVKAYELRIPLRIKSRWDSNLDPGPAGMDLT
jgi:hypothetical protein